MKKILMALFVSVFGLSCAAEPPDVGETLQLSVMPTNPERCQHNPILPDPVPCTELTQLAPVQWNWYACGTQENCSTANNNYGGNNAICAAACGLPPLASYGDAPHSSYNTAACIDMASQGLGPQGHGICSFESKSN